MCPMASCSPDRPSASETESRLSRSFHWLNVTQFLGALNDNLFKQFVIFFLIALAGKEAANSVSTFAAALFALPFLLFNNCAGVLADRHSKRHIVVFAKWLELAVMLMGLAGFLLRSAPLLYGTLFVMAFQSAIFGPAKYGIVPELVSRDRLSAANGLLTMFTYVAIILGTALAPWLGEQLGGRYAWAHLACLLVAAVGVGVSLPIRVTPPAGSTRKGTFRVVTDIVRTLRSLRGNRTLLTAVVASACFSLIGAYLQINLVPFGVHHLGLTQEKSGYLFFIAGIGIALGGWLAGRLSGRHIEFGIVPIGAVLLTGCVWALAVVPPADGTWRGAIIEAAGGAANLNPRDFLRALHDVIGLVFLVGVGAGLFLVPVDSFMQDRAPADRRGEIIAASSWLGWLGVLVSAGLVRLNPILGLSPAQGFFLLALLTLALTLVAFRVLPDFLLRFVALVLTRCAYRIRVLGHRHIPLDGPALLVANHATYLDALLLISTQQRRLRILMDRGFYDRLRRFRFLLDLMGVIPISHRDSPRRMVEAFQAARAALDAGYLVVVFAEGAVSRTGALRAFRAGFERITKDSTHPIIPVYIGGGWGSIWSYYHGRLVRQWPVAGRYPVTVLFGAPLPADTPAAAVRNAVMELSAAYFEDRKDVRLPLGAAFVRVARQRRRQIVWRGAGQAPVTYGRAVVRAMAAARRLQPRLAPGACAAVISPPSPDAALAAAALALLGRAAAWVDPQAAPEDLAGALHVAGARLVLAPRADLDRVALAAGGDIPVLALEALTEHLTLRERAAAVLRARFLPLHLIGGEHAARAPGAVAAVLFRGGNGQPVRGIPLTHHQVHSTIEGLRVLFEVAPMDVLASPIPFSQATGLVAGHWFPLLSGVAAEHPAQPDGLPRDVTLLLAPADWLDRLAAAADTSATGCLRMVVALATRLGAAEVEAFEKRFSVRPMTGYGLAETGGVAAVSLPHVEAGGLVQEQWRADASGMPLPGVAVRIVREDTGEPAPPGTAGWLEIKGPNVFTGYLHDDAATAQVLREGWFRPGTRATLDADGFLRLVP